MSRLYVTGARGMLGAAVAETMAADFEIRATDLPEADITDAEAIKTDITTFAPEIVIHLASMTDVDGCELDPPAAVRVNRQGTRNVAEACREAGASMVYVSTGMIYNGKKPSPYIEYDRPDPISVYGRTKYEGELEMRAVLDDHLTVNTCWIFGGGGLDVKFVPKILELARREEELRVVEDRFGSPTYTWDLAAGIRTLVSRGVRGRVHCVNAGWASRYDMAREIVSIAGLDGCTVVPVTSDAFDLPAPRPVMEAMSDYRMRLMGLAGLRPWREALSEYILSTLLP